MDMNITELNDQVDELNGRLSTYSTGDVTEAVICQGWLAKTDGGDVDMYVAGSEWSAFPVTGFSISMGYDPHLNQILLFYMDPLETIGRSNIPQKFIDDFSSYLTKIDLHLDGGSNPAADGLGDLDG